MQKNAHICGMGIWLCRNKAGVMRLTKYLTDTAMFWYDAREADRIEF